MDASSQSHLQSLVAFYDGTGTDRKGRSLSTILEWDSTSLELQHDYIQTLFPLPERSLYQWGGLVIDSRVFNAFRSRPELRGRLRDAFKKLLWFYGLELGADDEGNPIVNKGPNYETNPKVWNRKLDHNHLRITRIIRSLRVLGLEAEGVALYEALVNYSTGPNHRSREFWRRAAVRSLNIPPDDPTTFDFDLSIGPKFLREFEKERMSVDTSDDDSKPPKKSLQG